MFSKKLISGMIVGQLILGILSNVLGADAQVQKLDLDSLLKQNSSGTEISIKLESSKIYVLGADFECKDKNIQILGDNSLIQSRGSIKLNNCSLAMSGVGVYGDQNNNGFLILGGKDKISISKGKISNFKTFIKSQGVVPSISFNSIEFDSNIGTVLDIVGGKVVLVKISGSILNSLLLNVGKASVNTLYFKDSYVESKNPIITLATSVDSKLDKLNIDKTIVNVGNFVQNSSDMIVKIVSSKFTGLKEFAKSSKGNNQYLMLNSYLDGGIFKGSTTITKGLLVNTKISGLKSLKNSVVQEGDFELGVDGTVDNSLIYSLSAKSQINGKGNVLNSQFINTVLGSMVVLSKSILTEVNSKQILTFKVEGKDKISFNAKFPTDLQVLQKDTKKLATLRFEPSSLILQDPGYGITAGNLKYSDSLKKPQIDTKVFDGLISQLSPKVMAGSQDSTLSSVGALTGNNNDLNQNSSNSKEVKTMLPKELMNTVGVIALQGNDILNATYFGITGKNYFIIGIGLILILAFLGLFKVGKKPVQEYNPLDNDLQELKENLQSIDLKKAPEKTDSKTNFLQDAVASAGVLVQSSTSDNELLSMSIDTGMPELEEVKIEEIPVVEEVVNEEFKLEMTNPIEKNQEELETLEIKVEEPKEEARLEEVKIEETPVVEEVVSEEFKLEMTNPIEENPEELETLEIKVEEPKEETRLEEVKIEETPVIEEVVSEEFKLEMINPMEDVDVESQKIELDIQSQVETVEFDDIKLEMQNPMQEIEQSTSDDVPVSMKEISGESSYDIGQINIDEIGFGNIDITSEQEESNVEPLASSNVSTDEDNVFNNLSNNLDLFMVSQDDQTKNS